jgi:hypothetical protein
MKYLPASITDEFLETARSAMLGGEFAVYVTSRQAIPLGQVTLTAASIGTWTPQPGATIATRTLQDVAIVPITPIVSASVVSITLVGKDATAVTPIDIKMVAVFNPPARSGNQSYSFGRGFAMDMTVSDASGGGSTNDGKVASITAVQTPTIVNGSTNMKFRVYQLPELADYELIGATTDINFNAKDRVAIGIDAGMERDRWVKLGKSLSGELTIGSKFIGFSEGLARYGGQKCTVMLKALMEELTTTDHLVFTSWTASNKPKAPEGEGEVTTEATGKYQDHLFFIAP